MLKLQRHPAAAHMAAQENASRPCRNAAGNLEKTR